MTITVYSCSTGKIIRTVSASPKMVLVQCADGEDYVLGAANYALQYIDVIQKAAILRPNMSTTMPDSISTTETATITGPEGATVTITGPVSGTEILDADGLEFGSDTPGIYTVKVSLFPYLDAEHTLEITEP